MDETITKLSPAANVLLELLSLLEHDDRTDDLAQVWYGDFWRAKGLLRSPPPLPAAITELVNAGILPVREADSRCLHDIDPMLVTRVRARIDGELSRDFLAGVARAWMEHFKLARGKPQRGAVRAGIATAVYLRRLGNWTGAFGVLEGAVLDEACRSGEAEPVVRHLETLSDQSGIGELTPRFDRRAETLAKAHFAEGHWGEALDTVLLGREHAIRHSLGPGRLAVWRTLELHFRYALGHHAQVLDLLEPTLEYVEAARSRDSNSDALDKLHEQALHDALGSAKVLGDWPQALTLNRRRAASLESRGAPLREVVQCRLSDYAALFELGQVDEAQALLQKCQESAERFKDDRLLLGVFAARGVIASREGDSQAALSFKRRSLTHAHASALPGQAAYAHHIYANELIRTGAEASECAAHLLAGALLYNLEGDRRQSDALRTMLASVVEGAATLPGDPEALTRIVDRDGDLALAHALRSTQRAPEIIARRMTEILAALADERGAPSTTPPSLLRRE